MVFMPVSIKKETNSVSWIWTARFPKSIPQFLSIQRFICLSCFMPFTGLLHKNTKKKVLTKECCVGQHIPRVHVTLVTWTWGKQDPFRLETRYSHYREWSPSPGWIEHANRCRTLSFLCNSTFCASRKTQVTNKHPTGTTPRASPMQSKCSRKDRSPLLWPEAQQPIH